MKTRNISMKSIAAVLVLTVMGLFIPNTALCSDSWLYAKADKKQITRHEPKIKAAPEEDVPVGEPTDRKKIGAGKWVLIGLGAAAVIALVAGGGGGDDGGEGKTTKTGTFKAEW